MRGNLGQRPSEHLNFAQHTKNKKHIQTLMKLGYIYNNREEQAKVMQVLKLASESVALDELGIGRIRDAFADSMFPGTSTLQKHLKYFSLMPQLYRKACEKRYNRPSEVRAEVVKLERIMTKNLYDGSEDKRGITGSDVIGRDDTSYVKYDPAYIYNTGLKAFGILRGEQLYGLIFSASKSLHETPKPKRHDDENMNDDAADKAGLFQFCSFPNVEYDFTQQCSLDLTPADTEFITEHILNAEACKGTLFRHIVESPDFPLADRFEDIPTHLLPPHLGKLQANAQRFADFVFMLHVRYNYILSQYTDEEMRNVFDETMAQYLESGTDIEKVLRAVNIRENSGKVFCKACAERIAANDIEKGGGLDQTIIKRERRVKGSRRKIGNYAYDKKRPVHYYKLTYRWETVKVFAEELRKGAANG